MLSGCLRLVEIRQGYCTQDYFLIEPLHVHRFKSPLSHTTLASAPDRRNDSPHTSQNVFAFHKRRQWMRRDDEPCNPILCVTVRILSFPKPATLTHRTPEEKRPHGTGSRSRRGGQRRFARCHGEIVEIDDRILFVDGRRHGDDTVADALGSGNRPFEIGRHPANPFRYFRPC